MSENRQNVLDSIGILRQHLGYPPTLAEIARFNRVTVSTVQWHLSALQIEGLVTAAPKSPRSIVLTDLGRSRLSKVVAL